MGKRSNFNYGLPGGRAYYRGQDAYAAQSRENESRVVQQPGYMKAILQADTVYGTGVNTIKWTTATLSNFTKALVKFGWGYTESTGVFTCLKSALYSVNANVSVVDSVSADEFALQIRIIRNINNVPYTYLLKTVSSATTGTATDIVINTDFQFLSGDQVSIEFDNQGAGSRTVSGLSGAGTTTETQKMGSVRLREVD